MSDKVYDYKELAKSNGVRIPVDAGIERYKMIRVRFNGKNYEFEEAKYKHYKSIGNAVVGHFPDDPNHIRVMQASGIEWIKPLCQHFKYGDYVLCPEPDIDAIDDTGRPMKFPKKK